MVTGSTKTDSNSKLLDWNETKDFFRFTRGRWVVDEAKQVRLRTHSFDMNQLAREAARCLNSRCIHIEKLPDGLYNKAYLFRMNDGREVVGKVTNPSTGLPHYSTASEVATMDFMRNVLSTPVPQVFAWNSRASNPVGAEYIIMEKASGVPLRSVWGELKLNDRLKIVMKIFNYMKTWTSVSFQQQGSLYYASDVESPVTGLLYESPAGYSTADSRYTIGRSVGRDWIDEERRDLQISAGPWNSMLEYRAAISLKERAAIEQLKHIPKNMIMISGPGLYEPSPTKKLEALDSYDKLLPHLLPSDPGLNTSHLWHNDLHHENIFVDPSQPTEITAIIDWQSTTIAPLTDHQLIPSIINSEYDGPPMDDDLAQPTLLEGYASMSPAERRMAFRDLQAACLMVAWHRLVRGKNPSQYAALRSQDETAGRLLHLARRLFEIGEAHFLALVLDLRDEWAGSSTSPRTFPLHLSEAQASRMREDALDADAGIQLMQRLAAQLGPLWPDKGLARREDYEETKQVLAERFQELIRDHAETAAQRERFRQFWPFDQ